MLENAREWGLDTGQEWKEVGVEDSAKVMPLTNSK